MGSLRWDSKEAKGNGVGVKGKPGGIKRLAFEEVRIDQPMAIVA
jgi:hypothetical protein